MGVLARTSRVGAAAVGLLLTVGLAAQAASGLNPKQLREYAELNAKAARQKGSDLAETLARMAEYDLAFARNSYHSHDSATGAEHLDEATRHADRACAILQEEAARHKTNGMKKVEQSLQAIGFDLQGLAQTVNFQDQARVKAAQTHFSDLRSQVLQWMFG